ncbi:hypothetical protein MASR2M17_09340 [Aminivibrio sp.]
MSSKVTRAPAAAELPEGEPEQDAVRRALTASHVWAGQAGVTPVCVGGEGLARPLFQRRGRSRGWRPPPGGP